VTTHCYPTAALMARAGATDLEDIPYLPHDQVEALLTPRGRKKAGVTAASALARAVTLVESATRPARNLQD
jgi:hypothetical protein